MILLVRSVTNATRIWGGTLIFFILFIAVSCLLVNDGNRWWQISTSTLTPMMAVNVDAVNVMVKLKNLFVYVVFENNWYVCYPIVLYWKYIIFSTWLIWNNFLCDDFLHEFLYVRSVHQNLMVPYSYYLWYFMATFVCWYVELRQSTLY